MSNEEYTKLLALIGQQLKDSEESRVEWGKRHDQLMQAMLNGFLRFDTKFDALTDRVDSIGNRVDSLGNQVDLLGNRVDSLGNQVDSLSNRVDSLGEDMREVKERLGHLTGETHAIGTRLDATFDHVGLLTERTTSNEAQIADLRQQNREMDVRLDQRMRALEEFVNKL